MTITLFVIAFAAFGVGVFYVAVRLQSRRASLQSARPVDIAAFRTLCDRDDEAFFREKLPNPKFRRLKRQRISVTVKYISRISSNTLVVMRWVQSVGENRDPEIVQQALRATQLAVEVRRQCLTAYAKLAVEYALPSRQLSPGVLASDYQALRETVTRLSTLQAQKPALLGIAI
jgi:hypothetical protein